MTSALRVTLAALLTFATSAAVLVGGVAAPAAAGDFDGGGGRITSNGKTYQVMDFKGGEENKNGAWVGYWVADGGADQIFRLAESTKQDGSLQIRTSANKCLMPGGYDIGLRSRPIVQQPCDGQNAWQFWYLIPYGDEGRYLIANTSDNQCLDAAATYAATNLWPCHGAPNQQWIIGGYSYAALTRAAAQYGMTKCTKEPGTCTYRSTSTTTKATGNPICVYDHFAANGPVSEVSYTVSETSGTSTLINDSIAIGNSTTVSFRIGGNNDLFQGGVTTTFSTLLTHSVQTGTSNSSTQTWLAKTPNIPAGMHGYILATPTLRTYTGSFVFNRNSWNEWSYGDGTELTIQVPTTGTLSTVGGISSQYCGQFPEQLASPQVLRSTEPSPSFKGVSGQLVLQRDNTYELQLAVPTATLATTPNVTAYINGSYTASVQGEFGWYLSVRQEPGYRIYYRSVAVKPSDIVELRSSSGDTQVLTIPKG